jgi:hypothetical protein
MPAVMTPALRARLGHVRDELARRTGARALLRHGWLEVDEDDEAREDVLDVALEQGLTAIDPAGPELVTRCALTASPHPTLVRATGLLAACDTGYLVVEGGPSLAFYLQAFVDDGETRFEAVAGRHLLGHTPRSTLERLKLLGFRKDEDGRPNLVRGLREGESIGLFAHLATRALIDVYGVASGQTVRVRLAEVEDETDVHEGAR